MNQNFNELKIDDNLNNQNIKYENGERYVGQIVNGIRKVKEFFIG